MKYRILHSTPLEFYDTNADLVGSITANGTNLKISSVNGIIELGNTATDIQVGTTGTSVNWSFLGGGVIGAAGTGTISMGQSGDTVNMNVAGVTYNWPAKLLQYNQITGVNNKIDINTSVPGSVILTLPNRPVVGQLSLTDNIVANSGTSGTLQVAGGASVTGNLYAGNVVSLGGITVEGSLDSGSGDYAGWRANGTNIILKGNDVGRSGIFFQSEKNGVNINHPTDFGYIQFHPYGIDGSIGESNRMVIGVANDTDDYLVLQSPYKNGVKISYKDTTSGTGGTEYTVWHAGNHGTGSGLDADYLDGLHGSSYANSVYDQAGFTQANSAILSAQGAFEKGNTALIVGQNAYNLSNTSSQLAFSNITVNGVTLSANNKQTNLQLTSGNGVTLLANSISTSINVQLTSTGVTAGTYGSSNSIPVITVDTQGRISFVNAVSTGSSSGASLGYPHSSISTIPGSSGNKDLATGVDNVTAETPFQAAVDAFGVIVTTVYDCMDPIGSYTTFDLNT